jgi:hypothetical protein
VAPSANDLIVFPAYQLLVVEERLREQEAVELPPEMDPTDCALGLLVDAELTAEDHR